MDMCKEWEILNVGNKYKVGQIITGIYSKDLHQYTCPSTGEVKYHYVGMKARDYVDRSLLQTGMVIFPTNWIAAPDGDVFIINIPTALTLNDEPFEISFGLDSETGYFQMILNGKLVKLLAIMVYTAQSIWTSG